jgi:hypothetical protein
MGASAALAQTGKKIGVRKARYEEMLGWIKVPTMKLHRCWAMGKAHLEPAGMAAADDMSGRAQLILRD